MPLRKLTAEEVQFFDSAEQPQQQEAGGPKLTPIGEKDVQLFEDISPVEGFARGTVEGGALGFSEKLPGLLRLIPPFGALELTKPNLVSRFQQREQEATVRQEAAKQAQPTAFGAGEIAGTVGPLLVGGPAGLAAKAGTSGLKLATKVAGKGVRGALLSGTRAAGSSERTLGEEGFIPEVAGGAAAGALVGGGIPVAGAGGKLIARAGKAVLGKGRGLKERGFEELAVRGMQGIGIPSIITRPAIAAGRKAAESAGPKSAAPKVPGRLSKLLKPVADPAGRIASGSVVLGAGEAGRDPFVAPRRRSPRLRINQVIQEARDEGGQQQVNETEFILQQKGGPGRKLVLKKREAEFKKRQQ